MECFVDHDHWKVRIFTVNFDSSVGESYQSQTTLHLNMMYYAKVKTAYFSEDVQLQMELLQEKIRAPGPPLAPPPPQENGLPENYQEFLKGKGVSRNSKDGEKENLRNNGSKYYNSKFAQFDAICGGDEKYERVPMSQHQLNYDKPDQSGGSTGVNTVRMENGILNIHIPCAYTYPYIPPNNRPKEDASKRVKKKTKDQIQSKPSIKPPQRDKSKGNNGRDSYDCAGPPPFCSTVNNVRGPPNRGYFPPCPPPDCGGPIQGRIKTSMKWDYDCGKPFPFAKVEYGEELYEQAAQNMAQQIAMGNIPRSSKGGAEQSTSTIPPEPLIGEDKCRDFGRPAFHSSLKATGDLAKAMDHLNRLPAQMEKIFMKDERFEPIVYDRATKVLNVPREEKVFKDLISVEPNNEAKERVTKSISEQIKAVRPPARSRDAEPNLLDYQESSFSRIRPTSVDPPPKPQAGVSVDIRPQTEYQVIDAEKQFEDAADKI